MHSQYITNEHEYVHVYIIKYIYSIQMYMYMYIKCMYTCSFPLTIQPLHNLILVSIEQHAIWKLNTLFDEHNWT